MAKKNQAVRNSQDRSQPIWVWLLASFILGAVVSAVVIQRDRSDDPFNAQVPKPAANAQTPEIVGANSDQPAEIEPAKPKYDFYSVLAEREVEVNDAELKQRIETPVAEPTNVRYFVQLGSFPAESEADGLKAQLALSGVQANISAVKVNGKTWYRVRRGPFKNTAEVEGAKSALVASGVKAIVIREAGP